MIFYYYKEGLEPTLPLEMAAIVLFKDDIVVTLCKVNEEFI